MHDLRLLLLQGIANDVVLGYCIHLRLSTKYPLSRLPVEAWTLSGRSVKLSAGCAGEMKLADFGLARVFGSPNAGRYTDQAWGGTPL